MSFLDRYKAVIFDLDGTLADSMGVWDGICEEWGRSRGGDLPADINSTIAIMTLQESARYVVEHYARDLNPDRVLEEWNAITVEKYRTHVRPKDGAVELLRGMRQKGVPMAVATSSFPDACHGFLKQWDLENCFQTVLFTDEVGKDKTHPDAYLECARRLGINAGDCVVLEDLPDALKGVRAAEMGFVAVYDAGCPDWDRFSQQADYAVQSLRELL